ncbi:MAG: DUF1573 domain-containing protein [Armatimonadetes bacterium]|nr:DUF1573 domain-containing protein [Armatimonadota bacterium]
MRMHRYSGLVAAFAVVVALSASMASAAPKIAFSNTKYDWGKEPQGAKVNLVWDFKNTGDQTLTINNVRTSCGCTNAQASTKTIAPGKSAKITAVFNSAGYRGKVMKSITVETNDPQNGTVSLTAAGLIQPPLDVFPQRVNFGTLKPGKTFQQTIIVKSSNPAKIWVTSAETQANFITLGKPVKHGSEKGAWEIKVTVKNNGTNSGRVYESILIRSNEANGAPVVQTVTGTLASS